MKLTPVLIKITIHKVALSLKFPASLSIQMQIGSQRRQVLASTELSSNPLSLDLKTQVETQLNYDTKSKEFDSKTMSIILFLITKSSSKRIKAGIAQIIITKSSLEVKYQRVNLIKCHDFSAFIEYSLKSRLSYSRKAKIDRERMIDSHEGRLRISSSIDVFKSAVYYKTNPQMSQAQQKSASNELQRYLKNSIKQPKSASKNKCKHRLSQKNIEKQMNWMDDDSKTERRSYGMNRQHQPSIRSKADDFLHVKISNQSQKNHKEVENAKIRIEHLSSQNKELKIKINSLNDELDKRETTISSLRKKIEMKESTHNEQVKLLRVKLTDIQYQFNNQLKNQNIVLSSISSKEKQMMIEFKEKEKKNNEIRKQLQMTLGEKEIKLNEMKKECINLKEMFAESQQIVDHLTQDVVMYQKKIQEYNTQIKNYVFKLERAEQEISEMRENINETKQKTKEIKELKKQLQNINRKQQQYLTCLHQNQVTINEFQIQIQKLKSKNTEKQCSITSLVKQNKLKSDRIDELIANEKQLKARIYRIECNNEEDNTQSVAINKQIRTVQMELSKMKLESQYNNATRAKKLQQYEKINELLNKKMELLAQQNIDLLQKVMTLKDKYDVKEDEYFYIARQLVAIKEQVVSLEGELQAVREDRDFLDIRVKELELKQQEVIHLRDKLQHGEKMLEELQHRQQLRQIELTTEIQIVTGKKQEKEEQIERMKEEIRKLQQQMLDYQSQVEDCNYSIKNLQKQLIFAKLQASNYKNNNIHFEQRMMSLQRTEATSLSSIQELYQQNFNYRLMLKQNQDAMTALGKRYDNLFKSIVQSLERFYQLLTHSRNIANQHIKNDKVQIANVLNDSLRHIGQQRAKHQEVITGLESQIIEQRAKNSEASKLIKIKTQIQEQLQQDVANHKAYQQKLNQKISSYEEQIKNYQNQIKDKMNQIRQIKLHMEGLRKQHREEINLKQDAIKGHIRQISKLTDQVAGHVQNFRKTQQLFKKKIAIIQQQAQNKLYAANSKYLELEETFKTEKESLRLLKSKSAQQEVLINKLNKQKELSNIEMEKKTKELISVKAESQFRYKLVNEKLTQISQLKVFIDKLQKQKDFIEAKRKNLQQGNKSLVIVRGELEDSIKQKNSEIVILRSQITELQQAKVRLTKNKQDLLYAKKNQEATIRDLNQNCKILKESLMLSEQNINKAKKQKDELEKQCIKKLNISNKQSQNLQKQLDGLRIKSKEVAVQQRQRSAGLVVQLNEANKLNRQYQQQISSLKQEITISNGKILTLNHQLSNKLPQNNHYIHVGKEKELADLINQLNILSKQAEITNKKFPNISKGSSIDKNLPRLGQLSRDISTAANKLKIFILNRKNLPSQQKLPILEELRILQGAVENLCKQCLL